MNLKYRFFLIIVIRGVLVKNMVKTNNINSAHKNATYS